ncbi:hypothetical protein PPYR_00993 [Photinus pyralis]|uniref:Tudor domain-containing protein n=1 Tax=Photinus pyralis TaxID=7054 RepID=A0A1Y1KCS0_PHOPY|nr:uncharacterized protein LOC116170011 isoform X2 [Photinus pyralis]KAB0804023.1 hypothetical protein PPYR_00993 [Photinus pyralis]
MATKSSPSIRFTNIPSHYDRTKLYNIFSKYGKVKKLFIQPEYEYGNVYLETAEICEKTYKDLKSNCELNLTLLQPRTNSEHSNDNSSNHNSSSSRENGHNDVDTSVVKNFVDVFGRLVTTLQDDDGNLYVSLNELKRSGFELFEVGTLPSREGSHIHNQQKLEQFKIYMKSKAAEFMSQVRYSISTETLDEIIESEKKSFFSDRGGTNSTTRRSFDNAERDRSRSRPRLQSGRSSHNETGKSYYNEQRNTDSFHSSRNGTTNSDGNERYRNQNRRSFSDINRSDNNLKGFGIKREQHYDNESNVSRISVESERVNNIKPLTQMPISLNKPQEEDDGTYVVKDVQPDTPKLSTSTPIKTENVNPPAELRKPHIASPIQQVVDTPEKKIKRSLVIETVCDAGVFQFCETTSDHTFTGFALPDGFDKEFETLSEIGLNSAKNPKYLPKIGDIVGVDHDGDVARGLILSRTRDQYRCALIDYGITSEKSQVRQLQEKYTLLPEFSFECEAEMNTIKKLQLYTGAIKLSIKSPCKISLCLESGETYEFIGKPIHSQLKVKESNIADPKTIPSPKTEEAPTEAASSATSQEKPVHKADEIIFTPRKLVIEDLCDRGTFDFIEKTGDNTFTCFVCPEKYLMDLNLLDMIYKDTKVDKSFKPCVGDLVAANAADEGLVRGIVLNTLSDQYECALIDYGTIQKVVDVRALPEKYMNIPEFVCECKVDPEIIKDLENVKNSCIQIKSPCTLTIKPNSGKEFVAKGFHWNPLKQKPSETKRESLVRRMSIDETTSNGVFQFAERIDVNTFLGCVIPSHLQKLIEDLQEIDKDSQKNPPFNPNIGDIVAAPSIYGFARAQVIDYLNNQFTCAFIDYGYVKQVEQVRCLSDKYTMIPEFAFQCTADPKIIEDLQNFSCQALQIKAPGILSVKLENGEQHVLEGYRWKPTKAHMNTFKTINKCETYKRPGNVSLNDGDKVLLVRTLDNGLLVRNRECHITFTAVTQELANYQGKSYEQPQVGCLAVCNFHDNQLYRVVINKIDGATATLDYIDYGNVDTSPVSDLKTINEKLATMNNTLANIHLKGFVKQKFNTEMLTFLANCSDRREKFNACKIPGEEFYDLIGADGVSLTEKLNKLQKNQMEDRSTTPKSQTQKKTVTPKSQEKSKSVSFNLEESTTPTSQRVKDSVCRLEDVVKFDVKPGDLKLLCTYVGHLNEGLVSFCKADEETNMLLDFVTETVTKCMETDTCVSYSPSLGEVCLAKFEGDWFRAAVVKIVDNKFRVYFVDYGNHHVACISDLRKLPPELSKAKALAMMCKLDGIMKDNAQTVNDRLLSRLKDDIVESEIYHATISSVSDNLYYLIIPSLMKQWKADGLV